MNKLVDIAQDLPTVLPATASVDEVVRAICASPGGIVVLVEDGGEASGVVGALEAIHAIHADDGHVVIRPPIIGDPEASATQALEFLHRHSALELLVETEAGWRMATLCALHRAAGSIPADDIAPTVASVTESVVTVHGDATLSEVAQQMHDQRLALVVVAEGKPEGIVQALDLICTAEQGFGWDAPVRTAVKTVPVVQRTLRLAEAEPFFQRGAPYLIVAQLDGTLAGGLAPCSIYQIAHAPGPDVGVGLGVLFRDNPTWQAWDAAAGKIGQGLFEWDLWRDDFWVSDGWKRYLGYPLSAGKRFSDWTDRLHPDDMGPALRDLQTFLRSDRPSFRNVHRVRDAQGAFRWTLLTGWVEKRGDHGEPLFMRGSMIDISEVYVHGAQDRQHVESLQRMFDAYPDPAWFADPDGGSVAVNTALVRHAGVDRETLTSRANAELWPALGREADLLHRRAIEQGSPQRILKWLNTEMGNRWVELVSAPVFHSDRELEGVITVARDMTAQRRVSDMLGEEREHLQSIIDRLPNLICGLSERGTVTHVNASFLAACGLPLASVIGKSWQTFIDAAPPQVQLINTVCADGGTSPSAPVEMTVGGQRAQWRVVPSRTGTRSILLDGTLIAAP